MKLRLDFLIQALLAIGLTGCREEPELVATEDREEIVREQLIRDHQWQNSPASPDQMFSLVFQAENAQILGLGGAQNFDKWDIVGDTLLLWKESVSSSPEKCFRIGFSPQKTAPDSGNACTRDTLYVSSCVEQKQDTLVYNCMPGM